MGKLDEIITEMTVAKQAAVEAAHAAYPDEFETSALVEPANQVLDRYKSEAKQQIKDLIKELVGKQRTMYLTTDDRDRGDPLAEEAVKIRNQLRREIIKDVEAL